MAHSNNGSSDLDAWIALFGEVANQLGAANATERPQGSQQVNGFQHIGLPLGIIPAQQVKTRREIHVEPGVITEIPQAQVLQMHFRRMRTTPSASESIPLRSPSRSHERAVMDHLESFPSSA